MEMGPDIASIAGLIGDPVRATILAALVTAGRQDLGVQLPRSAWTRDSLGRACLDWTERRHHLGGELGVALFTRLKGLGWLVANPKTRAVRVTHAGVRELHKQLGINISL